MNILKWNSFVRIFKNIKICQLSDLHKSLIKVFCVILINANLYEYYILTVDLQSVPQQLGYKNFIRHKHFYLGKPGSTKDPRALWSSCVAEAQYIWHVFVVYCQPPSEETAEEASPLLTPLFKILLFIKLDQLVQAHICIINQKPLTKHFICDIN